jgi:2-(1,2-epoxy-1,2-dihydrophenyl)acetyl-CoA isomerase
VQTTNNLRKQEPQKIKIQDTALMPNTPDSVITELNAGVLSVTLNEPDTMNALSAGISGGLSNAVARANADDDVRVLLLTGTGRAFCAGAAVGAMASGAAGGEPSRHQRLDSLGGSARHVEAFANCDVPIIAAVNGAAVGAGFGIATSCDIRLLGASARMGSIFIKRGLASDYGVAYWLPRIVGAGRAMEIMYSGELLDAEQCLAIGLANKVFADDVLLEEAQKYARMIAEGPPLAYTLLRRMMQKTHDLPMAEFAEYEWTNQKLLLATNDVKEGFTSFIERRPAKFQGN